MYTWCLRCVARPLKINTYGLSRLYRLFACVCIYVCVCVLIHPHMYICVRIFICVCIYVCVCVFIHPHMYICVRIFICVKWIYALMSINVVHLNIRTQMYIYVYMNIYTHTYIYRTYIYMLSRVYRSYISDACVCVYMNVHVRFSIYSSCCAASSSTSDWVYGLLQLYRSFTRVCVCVCVHVFMTVCPYTWYMYIYTCIYMIYKAYIYIYVCVYLI